MRNSKIIPLFIFMNLFIVLVTSQISANHPDDNSPLLSGTYTLENNSYLCVSVDWGWARNNKTPVRVEVNEFEFCLWVNTHRLTEDTIENCITQLLAKGNRIPFRLIEDNHLRTRLRTTTLDSVSLNIEPGGKAGIYWSGGKLSVGPLYTRLEKKDSLEGGIYELDFHGVNQTSRKEFLFLPARGVILLAGSQKAHGEVDSRQGWARKTRKGDNAIGDMSDAKSKIH